VIISETRDPAILLSSQPTYQNGDIIRVTLPPLPEGQAQYVGISLPGGGDLYLLSQLNVFTLFDGNTLPLWQGEEVAIELPTSADLPRGVYPLYLLRVPNGIEPLANSQWWVLGVSEFQIN
jgi:hypothetical protein